MVKHIFCLLIFVPNNTEWIILLFCNGEPRRSAESDKWATA